MQTFLFKFGSWYLLVAMLVLAILSIKAYRVSLKKIFILFMIISIPTSADYIYNKVKSCYVRANILVLKKHHNTIPNLIMGKDFRSNSKHRSKSVQLMQYRKECGEIWNESTRKQEALKTKYADAVNTQKKRTWLRDLWNNIIWRLSRWLFPIAAIIICINEIKKVPTISSTLR